MHISFIKDMATTYSKLAKLGDHNISAKAIFLKTSHNLPHK